MITDAMMDAALAAYGEHRDDYHAPRVVAMRNAIEAALDMSGDGEAVAWHTEDHLSDRSATTYDKAVADRWLAKGWPVTPLYTHPPKPVVSGAVLDTIALRTMRECWDAAEYTVSRSQARAKIQNIIRAALTAALGVKS